MAMNIYWISLWRWESNQKQFALKDNCRWGRGRGHPVKSMVCWDLITSVHLSLDATESGLGNKNRSARTSVANWVVTVVSHLHRGGFD